MGLWLRAILWACAASGFFAGDFAVGPVPEEVRTTLQLDAFYAKHTSVHGFAIVGSAKVSDFALREAAYVLSRMMAGREDILGAMAERHVRIAVMAWNEFTTDIPEHRELTPRVFWDRRARGLGGSPVSCGEENLLGLPGDPYAKENLLIHEFAHAVHGYGLRTITPDFDQRLRAAYERAVASGLWKNTYAGTNHGEYWAEAVQDWFDNNRENDSLHNHVNTRAELKEYDPDLAALCAEVFGENPWRYRIPMERAAADRAHLAGYDLSAAPRFRWREEPVPDSPRVLIQTALGDIEVELDARRAPATVRNFLRYVHEGLYADGSFSSMVTLPNQSDAKVRIEGVQAQADPARESEFLPAIALERTRDTGLRHLDGTLSMARASPDTARDSFFICIGDQPELDFGGTHHPDGQGFAAFGKVVRGMEIVRKIRESRAEGEELAPAIPIQRAIRLN
ncbi:MAG: peptidylprolyl isomerase [Planctomycetota bacterium]